MTNAVSFSGLTDAEKWADFQKGLKSAPKYDRAVKRYLKYCENTGKVWESPVSLDNYIDEAHDRYLTNPKAEDSFCGKTCWTVVSMINSYFKQLRGIDAMKVYPPLENKLKRWQKVEEVKKAKVFTYERLKTFWDTAPDDSSYLPKKLVSDPLTIAQSLVHHSGGGPSYLRFSFP